MTKAVRTLNDLKSGADATAIDVLRLAFHYIIRGGWAPHQPASAGATLRVIGIADRPTSIEGAILRARADLRARWVVGITALEAIRIGIGATPTNIQAIAYYERDAGRSIADVKTVFQTVICDLNARQKGSLVNVRA